MSKLTVRRGWKKWVVKSVITDQDIDNYMKSNGDYQVVFNIRRLGLGLKPEVTQSAWMKVWIALLEGIEIAHNRSIDGTAKAGKGAG